MNKKYIPLIIILLIASVVHLSTLMLYPAPYQDEAWFGGRAWFLVQHGFAFSSFDSGVIDKYEGYWSVVQWLPAWIESIPLRFQNYPNLVSLRLVSYFFSLLLIVSIYSISKFFGGNRLAIVSSSLLVLSFPFFISAHMARPDIYLSALGFFSIFLFFYKNKYIRYNIIIGILTSIAIEIHPNALIFIFVLLSLYLIQDKLNIIRSSRFWGFCVGLIVGFIFYIYFHIWFYPNTYFYLQKLLFTGTHLPPILTLHLSFNLIEIYNFLRLITVNNLLAIPMLFWSTITIINYRIKSNINIFHNKSVFLHVINITLFTSRVLWIRNWPAFYNILYQPILDIIFGCFVLYVWDKPIKSSVLGAMNKAISILLLSLVLYNSLFNLDFKSTSTYWSTVKEIKDAIKPGDRIIGEPNYWFGLFDHDYLVWEQLIYYQLDYKGSNLRDAFMNLDVDIFIIDQNLDGFISDEKLPEYQENLKISKLELVRLLNSNGILIKSFWDPYYGQIRIYRLFF